MSAGPILQTAVQADLDALWPAVQAAHIFPDRAGLERFFAQEPWRVQWGRRGAAAIVEKWRDHLDILAVRGVWASGRDLARALADLRALAGTQGFSRLLSPLVSYEASGPYERAGFEPIERLTAYRTTADIAARMSIGAPEGVCLRPAVSADVGAIGAIDDACFEPFWAYGSQRLASALSTDLVTVAQFEGGVIGYTLSTIERSSGTLGRIAVSARHRGRGVGRALLAASAQALVRSGAGSVSLCTQEANVAARTLYVRAGMRELPGKLVFLVGEVEGGKGRP